MIDFLIVISILIFLSAGFYFKKKKKNKESENCNISGCGSCLGCPLSKQTVKNKG